MAKEKIVPISEKHTRLNYLKVLRSAKNTNKYDDEIKSLEMEIDYLNFGIKN